MTNQSAYVVHTDDIDCLIDPLEQPDHRAPDADTAAHEDVDNDERVDESAHMLPAEVPDEQLLAFDDKHQVCAM